MENWYNFLLLAASQFTKVFTILGNAKVTAIWHAPLALKEDGPRFPLIVYSHGLGSNRTMYSTICCEMASHGFIVAAIEHR